MTTRTLSVFAILSFIVLAGCPAGSDQAEQANAHPAAHEPTVAAPAAAVADPAPVVAAETPRAEIVTPATEAPPPVTPVPKPTPAVQVASHAPEKSSPPPAPPAAATPAPKPVDPLQLMQEQQKSRAEQAAALNKAQADMTAAQAEVQTLEQRLLQTRNPFGPRPESNLPADEAKEWTKLDGVERVKRVEDQLAAARLKADAARSAYVALGGRID